MLVQPLDDLTAPSGCLLPGSLPVSPSTFWVVFEKDLMEGCSLTSEVVWPVE